MKQIFGAALLGAALISGSANAAVVGVSGQMEILATPTSVTNLSPFDNDAMQIFNEVQNLVLGSALTLRDASGGPDEIIAAGTWISSHMIFLNRTTTGTALVRTGMATFDGIVLGLITSSARLDATDALLGAIWTTYQFSTTPGFGNRGLEGNEGAFALSNGGETLALTLRVTQPGDWIRVVTLSAVPVPAAGFLLIGALGGLAALRRRKAVAA